MFEHQMDVFGTDYAWTIEVTETEVIVRVPFFGIEAHDQIRPGVDSIDGAFGQAWTQAARFVMIQRVEAAA